MMTLMMMLDAHTIRLHTRMAFGYTARVFYARERGDGEKRREQCLRICMSGSLASILHMRMSVFRVRFHKNFIILCAVCLVLTLVPALFDALHSLQINDFCGVFICLCRRRRCLPLHRSIFLLLGNGSHSRTEYTTNCELCPIWCGRSLFIYLFFVCSESSRQIEFRSQIVHNLNQF